MKRDCKLNRLGLILAFYLLIGLWISATGFNAIKAQQIADQQSFNTMSEEIYETKPLDRNENSEIKTGTTGKNTEVESLHYVGEIYGGGIVFWTTPDKKHGLITSLHDIEVEKIEWGFYGHNIEDCNHLTDGYLNTISLVLSKVDTLNAAAICYQYNGGGYIDWYLPSIRELCLMASQDIMINTILDNDNDNSTYGFYGKTRKLNSKQKNFCYWSSTQHNEESAWAYNFNTGQTCCLVKHYRSGIRAIRKF